MESRHDDSSARLDFLFLEPVRAADAVFHPPRRGENLAAVRLDAVPAPAFGKFLGRWLAKFSTWTAAPARRHLADLRETVGQLAPAADGAGMADAIEPA